MIERDDERWMRLAIETATQRGSDPADTPIGAVIVRDGRVLAASINMTEQDCDPTAHAEMVAIRAAGAKLGNMELRGATLYSTLQPCGMCTMASIWAKVGRVVYGAGRGDVHPMYFEDRQIDTLDFVRDAWRGDLMFEGCCLRDECAALYYGPDDEVPVEDQGNV
ncbi:nucleoside deaminase [Sphingomonas sp.]|uniref:nucleoside deaminase n=1 Tax=Sphingomonas sp. TaxID=28214 RepID=UPI003AFFA596